MRSEDLTTEQAEKLLWQLRPSLDRLHSIEQRMKQRDFPADDPLFRDVQAARIAMGDLAMSLHYLSCKGVGRPGHS